jgi:hypothetical protein
MLSPELTATIDKLKKDNAVYAPLVLAVEKIAQHYRYSIEHIVDQADGGEKQLRASAELQGKFQSLSRITKDLSPSGIFRAADAFRNAAIEVMGKMESSLPDFTIRLEAFTDAFDEFLRSQSARNAALLMFEANRFDSELVTCSNWINFVSGILTYNAPQDQETSCVSLTLETGPKLSTFLAKLNALQSLYSELCMIAHVSEVEHPLKVVRIESGSLWVKVFGETKIIGAIAGLMEATVRYLHRQYTNEGKIASVPRRIEALESAIQFSTKLSSIGVDTSEINEQLRKSGVAVAQNLAKLLEDQSTVEINQQAFSVGGSNEPFLLARHKTLQLGSQEEQSEPTLESPAADGSSQSQPDVL